MTLPLTAASRVVWNGQIENLEGSRSSDHSLPYQAKVVVVFR
jgi:hypothetical protein